MADVNPINTDTIAELICCHSDIAQSGDGNVSLPLETTDSDPV